MQHDDRPLATTPLLLDTEMGGISVAVLKTKTKLDQYPIELGTTIQNESENVIGSVRSYLTSPYTQEAAMSTMITMLGYLTTRNPHHVGRLNNYHNYVMLAKINEYNLRQEILAEAVKSHRDKVFVYQPTALSEKHNHTEDQKSNIHDAWVVSIHASTPTQLDTPNSTNSSTPLKFICFSEESAHKFQNNIIRWIRDEPDIILLLTQGAYEFVNHRNMRPTDVNQLQIDINTAGKLDGVKETLMTLDQERKDFISMLTSLNEPVLSSQFAQQPSETTKRAIYANARALQASKTMLVQQVGSGHKQSLVSDYALHILDLNNLIAERGSELTSGSRMNHAIQAQTLFKSDIERIKHDNNLSADQRTAFQHFINNRLEDLSMLSIAEQTNRKENLVKQLENIDLRTILEQCTHPISSDILMIDQHELNDLLDSILMTKNTLVASNEDIQEDELTFENYKAWMDKHKGSSSSDGNPASDDIPAIVSTESIPELEPSSSASIDNVISEEIAPPRLTSPPSSREINANESNPELDKPKPVKSASFQLPTARSLYSFFGGNKTRAPIPNKNDELVGDINKVKDKLAAESPSEPSINIKHKR